MTLKQPSNILALKFVIPKNCLDFFMVSGTGKFAIVSTLEGEEEIPAQLIRCPLKITSNFPKSYLTGLIIKYQIFSKHSKTFLMCSFMDELAMSTLSTYAQTKCNTCNRWSINHWNDCAACLKPNGTRKISNNTNRSLWNMVGLY